MSITHSLSNALSGLTAASRMAEVVSSNVSNALTEGYGRRTLDVTSATVGGRGSGVQIDGVTRHVDAGVLANRRLADARLGAASFLSTTLGDIQNIVGAPGEDGTISDRIVAVEVALIDAQADPSSVISLTALQSKFSDLAQSLNSASDGIQSMRTDADNFISGQVTSLNAALGYVEDLNKDIVVARSSGVDASGLMDTRQQVIDQISEIVPIRQFERSNGVIALTTTAGQSLIDGKAQTFTFAPNATITADMTASSGALNGILLNGEQIAEDGLGGLTGGSLEAAFQARDTHLVDAQNSLDLVAADLIGRFQDQDVDSTIPVGGAGILTDAGAALQQDNIVGLSSRIAVNNQIDPSQGGAVTNLRDGLYATSVGNAGDATLLSALTASLSAPISNGVDTIGFSAAGLAASKEAEIGLLRLSYDEELSFETSRWSSLKEAESADGVDTDYELQILLRIEQAYAANARVIQTVDTLMQRLMEI